MSRGEHDGTVIYEDAHGRAAGFEPVPVFRCPGGVEHPATTDDHWLVGTVCWLVGEIYARWQHKRLDWPEWILAFKRGYQGNTN